MSASSQSLKRVIQCTANSQSFLLGPSGGTPITVSDPANPAYQGTRFNPLFTGAFRVGGIAVSFQRPVVRRIRLDLSMANYGRLTPGIAVGATPGFATQNIMGLSLSLPNAGLQKLLVNFNRMGEWVELESACQFTNDSGSNPISSTIDVGYPTNGDFDCIGTGFNVDLRNLQTIYQNTEQQFVLTAEIFCADYTLQQ